MIVGLSLFSICAVRFLSTDSSCLSKDVFGEMR